MISLETLKRSFVPAQINAIQFDFTDDTEQGIQKIALPSLNWFFVAIIFGPPMMATY